MCAVEQVRYYPLGDNMFPDMLADLKNARNSIYVEYFIIEPGHMWDAIVNELEVKMEQGVDVRVIYDDLGSISSFNFSNVRELKKKGIPCIPFNPFLALKGTANYRDHRKMLIIDNEVAYSGGINLSDRYINLEHPYGHSMLTVTIPADALTRLLISLETGDVRLAPIQLKTLNVALANGGLRAEDLTVTRDLLVELPAGGCNIDHLSVAEYANITATRCIRLHLDGNPADYTTDARTDNVVRIGNKEYDKRYTSTGPNGILNLYAKGLIDLNVDE